MASYLLLTYSANDRSRNVITSGSGL